LEWVRSFYAELFEETGGVPAPNEQIGGGMINHPDTDLVDPELNRTGVSWSTIYYRDNYPRLQKVKKRWDPLNVFHHALSIKADA
jgi:aclacinomycin oxidase